MENILNKTCDDKIIGFKYQLNRNISGKPAMTTVHHRTNLFQFNLGMHTSYY